MATVRFGVIGAGQIAQSSCKDIQSHPDAELVAASDIDAPRLKDLADKFEIGRTYADAADLMADADVDALYIGVPNAFHAPLAKAGLEAGKHVILDKPFALNIAEAEGVAAAARASGKTFMLGMNQRFRAESQVIRNLVRDGALGEVYHAKAFWFRRTGIPKLGTWFGKKKLAGGGALLDIGVHLLDLALYAAGNFKPVAVSGATYTKFGNRGLGEGGWGMSEPTEMDFDVDDFATAMIKFEGGLSVTLDVSWAIHQADANRMNVHLFGTEAGAGIYPAELYRYGSEPGSYEIVDKPEGKVDYPHENRFHNFVNALLGREEACVGVDESLAIQKILDGIYESCASGNEVRIA